MLELREVRKTFGSGPDAYVALGGVSLHVEAGEFFCLLGPSGCGKSTLLNILAGFDTVSSGEVSLEGRPITGPSRERVMLFQDAGSALLPWLSVEENMRFALRVRRIPKAQWESVIDRYLAMVDLDTHRRKFPAQLSGGMRQRLQIARALAVEPAVLLMDEPFAALDALTRRRMHGALLDIWRETRKTIVFVTHDIAEAIALADRIGVMTVGPESVFSHVVRMDLPRPRDPSDARVARLFGEIEGHLAPDLARADRAEAN